MSVTISDNYTQKIENSNGQPVYIGEASPGIGVSGVGWRIKKLTYTNQAVTDVEWASGNNAFVFTWKDRATYNYY